MRGEAISPGRQKGRPAVDPSAAAASAGALQPDQTASTWLSRLGAERLTAVRETWSIFWSTRVLIAALGVLAAEVAGKSISGSRFKLDVPGLTHPFGGPLGALFSSMARWDAVWYLGVAHSGYTGAAGGASRSTAFFPLYPLLVRITGGLSHSPAVLLIASYVVSLAAFAGALYLLHRLVTLELGAKFARPTLLLLAVFPAAFFFGAPYSESLFLLLTVGAFYAARTGRFALAGIAAAAASATRSEGILLMLPIAILYLYGPRSDRDPEPVRPPSRTAWLWPRYRLHGDVAFVLLAPLGLAAYSLHLALSVGDGTVFMHFEREWYRAFAGPFGGVWQGIHAAIAAIQQFASQSQAHHYFPAAGGNPFDAAGHNLTLFVFLGFAVVATVGVLRRLPLAYGSYVVASLALPLSFPAATQPLMSLPRFLAVLFPVFMWLALVCQSRRRREIVVTVFALAMGVFIVQYVTWHWVA